MAARSGETTVRLVSALQEEATNRCLWPLPGGGVGHPLGAPEAFSLVRDMPYGRASSREPMITIREWRGTCSGKHYLLRALFTELGLRADLLACTTRITADAAYLPSDVKTLLQDGPVIDIHNYLILHTPRGPMIVDATWPLEAKSLGLPVNEEFVWGRDMLLACTPIVHQIVPDEGDPQAFKEALLRRSARGDDLARRDAVIEAISRCSSRGPNLTD
jgi:hypothetical protein